MMSFENVLTNIYKKYQIDRENSIKEGKKILESIQPKKKIRATKITKDLIKIAISQIKSTYDRKRGGFGKTPKFPRISSFRAYVLTLYHLTERKELLDIVINSAE